MEEDDKKTVITNMKGHLPEADVPAKQQVCVVVIAGATAGMMYKLPELGELYIGRAADAGICIDEEGVSRKHARLSIASHRVILADLGSTNGTFVNGTKITERALQDGDKIQIGPQTVLKFQYQDALEEHFQRKLFDNAVKDGLTGVYNKKYFLDRIETDVAYAKRHQTPLTLLILDIDHFKKVNDNYGHLAGDYVLKELAVLVKRTIRSEDVLARFGGEEFVVLMRDADDEKALMLAERLRRIVEQTVVTYEDKRIPMTISIGIGTMSASPQNPPIQNATDLVNCADRYLYQAKRGGRNRVIGRTNDQ
ncbi:MAG: diguanylate cyclase [Gammaproteobacteria bacterium]|nr:diguanylate cyclase [Gammaproteobacteria bacterium]